MSDALNLSIVAPFSPIIMKARMPDILVASLNEQADRITSDGREREGRDWSSHLAGSVHSEMRFTDIVSETKLCSDFLYDVSRAFAYRCENALLHFTDYDQTEALSDTKLQIDIKEAWVNDMVAGDYNPAHLHQGCHFSCVGFLRMPPGFEAEFQADKARQNTTGCLQFIDSRSAVGVKNLFTVKPVIGDFYIWPSWMLHCVYPFKSAGIRRSIAANLALTA